MSTKVSITEELLASIIDELFKIIINKPLSPITDEPPEQASETRGSYVAEVKEEKQPIESIKEEIESSEEFGTKTIKETIESLKQTQKKRQPIDDNYLEAPDSLKPVTKIFDRQFSGLYYDEAQDLFYSTHTRRRTKPLGMIKWANVKHYTKSTINVPKEIKKVYKYVTLPTGTQEGEYIRISKKDWYDYWKTQAGLVKATNPHITLDRDLVEEW
jgi:hypothetical protein